MKRLQMLRLLTVFGFIVMALVPAAGMAVSQTPPTKSTINVPWNGSPGGAHNDVTVGPCAKDPENPQLVDVTLNAGYPPKPSTWKVHLDGQSQIDAGGNGQYGAGRMVGTLTAYQQGSVVWVTYNGFISGMWTYNFQPSVVFPPDQPLIVCILWE